MANLDNYPEKYLLFNSQKSKNLAIIMQIEGVPDLFSISNTFTTVRYGDANTTYGLPGLVYGGLRRVTGISGTGGSLKSYIVLDSSMTIGQRIEPEQGKGNVGTITMTLIDKNGEVSRIITPGIVVDEIMLTKEVKIFLGYAQTSFPLDFLLIYRGYITSLDCPPGLVKFQISDATTKKRQPIFNTPTTNTTTPLNNSQTNIPVLNTSGFHEKILGPDGNLDPDVKTYIRIDDEIMEYSSIVSSTSFTVTRGSLFSVADTHDIDASVSNTILLGNNVTGINCLTLVLKILLSGWNGPCEENVEVSSFVFTDNGNIDGAFVLENGVDAIKDLGLTVGDYFQTTGATNPSNNASGVITDIQAINGVNTIIVTDQTFVSESPTDAVSSFRSKYDTLPITAGAKCRMRDVDVSTIEMIRDTYFTSATTSNVTFYYTEPKTALDVIDTDILLEMGCYGISRFGKISVAITKPPLPGIGKLVTLDWTNVLDPDKIHVTRSANSRTFYNLIRYEYDQDYVNGGFGSVQYFLDTNSLNLFNQTQTLPITAPGLRSNIGGATVAQQRGRALLNRYKNIALTIELTVNWSVGSLIEVSDIVLLNDNGQLKIMNFETGERNLGSQLFEVIDRQYNVTPANVKLKLLGGLGFSVDSRFGLYSPSSNLNSGSTSILLRLIPSYGQTTVTAEVAKWAPFIGLRIQVRSYDFTTRYGITTIVRINPDDPTALDVDPPLSFTPQSGDIIDINVYPSTTDKTEDQVYKNLYTHMAASMPVVTGISNTQFTVSAPNAAKLTVGNLLVLRNNDYSNISPEVKISDITGTTITVSSSIGFTPNNTYTVDGGGFFDATAFYRFD